MCGRYVIAKDTRRGVAREDITIILEQVPERYNAAPGQDLPVITNEAPQSVQLFRWGLVPQWEKELAGAHKPANLRDDTLRTKASWQRILQAHRCLVPATGFYEWKAINSRTKQPYFFFLSGQEPFYFAGIWESWKNKGETLHTFSLITTEANGVVEPVNDRMAVILPKELESAWLDDSLRLKDVLDLLQPFDGKMSKHPVRQAVSKASNEYPELIQPVEEIKGLF